VAGQPVTASAATPREWGGIHSLYNWGPPPPPSFLNPEDLAELMTGSHSGA
jgi:hypothetical protein